MDSIILDNQIINALTLLEFRVIKANSFGYYDINKKIQGYLCKIIDYVYFDGSHDTVDLDNLKPNYPAIDIANYKFRVAYQITGETNTDKIYSTLTKFKNLSEFSSGILSEIRFLFIKGYEFTPKQYENIKNRFKELGLKFTPVTLISITMLEKSLSKINNHRKRALVEILNEELNNSNDSLKFITHREIEDLKKLYGKQRFTDIVTMDDAMDERRLQDLAHIFGIDVEELEMLDYNEEYISQGDREDSIMFTFIPTEDTIEIISKIAGIYDNQVEIYPWDWPGELEP